MNTRQDQDPAANSVDKAAVAKYLSAHPDFFESHTQLLSKLDLPHETGQAISLIERQVAVLRHHNHQHREQLQELIQIAKENEQLIQRLQQLTLNLLDTDQLPEIINLLRSTLQSDFHADAAALHFTNLQENQLAGISDSDFISVLTYEHDSDIPKDLTKIINGKKSTCGKFNPKILGRLFPEEGSHISTAALIPLTLKSTSHPDNKTRGILAIGSQDEHRFNAEMGTVYLQYMGELIGRKLGPHLRDN